MKWNDMNEEKPPCATCGIHDAKQYLILTNDVYGSNDRPWYRLALWMNNRFEGFPAGATIVTHWAEIEPPVGVCRDKEHEAEEMPIFEGTREQLNALGK